MLGARSVQKGRTALNEAFAADSSLQGRIEVIQIDIIDKRSIDAAKAQIEARFGKLDMLVNNAGIIMHRPDIDMLTSLREYIGTNTVGIAIVTKTLESLLMKSTSPRLIHVSSD